MNVVAKASSLQQRQVALAERGPPQEELHPFDKGARQCRLSPLLTRHPLSRGDPSSPGFPIVEASQGIMWRGLGAKCSRRGVNFIEL